MKLSVGTCLLKAIPVRSPAEIRIMLLKNRRLSDPVSKTKRTKQNKTMQVKSDETVYLVEDLSKQSAEGVARLQ